MNIRILSEKRRKHVKSCRDNNDNSHQLIADLYSEPSHFIYEILQNAEDAEAEHVEFILNADHLKITHNGKPFNFYDVDSITTIGSSTKADDINKIGKFGAGFKSVFAVTDTPNIHSGDYHFSINDFIVPEEIKPFDVAHNTVFILKFNHTKRSISESYEIIRDKLENLETESILFLSNIREIRWVTIENKGHYLKDVSDIEKYENAKKIYVISQKNENYDSQEYLVFEKTIHIEKKKLKTQIAYVIDSENDNRKIIIPFRNSKLSVYFPTNVRTGLNFLLQAPYKTTPNRETIPFDDEQNKILTNTLSELTAESLPILKNLGYITVSFLSDVLPTYNKIDHILFLNVYNAIKNKLLSNNKLLPTFNNNYTQSNNALLARGKNLASILNDKDLIYLFNKKNWLSTDITYDRTRTLRDYLIKEIGIKEIDFEEFAKSLTEDFLIRKSDEWLIEFYQQLIDQESLYRENTNRSKSGVLRRKPIIRLENGKHLCPYGNDGRLQVYLPTTKKSKFYTVKNIFAQNKASLSFLSKIGLKEPDRISEIKEHIKPKYRKNNDISKVEYIEDLNNIIDAYKNANDQQKDELIDLLKDTNIILISLSDGQYNFQIPSKVYFPTSELKEWFEGNSKIDFLDDDIHKNYKDDVYFMSLFKKLGVAEKTKFEGTDKYGGWEFWDINRSCYAQGLNGFNPNFQIVGIEYSLNNINLKRSLYIWKIILEKTDKIRGILELSSAKNFRGSYHEKVYESSNILKSLTDSTKYWLFDKNGNLIRKKISEITLDDLHDNYLRKHANTNDLVRILNLKLDEIKEIEEKTGGKLLLGKDLEEFKQWQADKKRMEKQQEDNWQPEISFDEIIPSEINDIFPEILLSPDYSKQDLINSSDGVNIIHNDNNENDKSEKDSTGTDRNIKVTKNKHSKEIGNWGEYLVKLSLEKKHKEDENICIVWLNENGNIGKGHDFVIKNSGNEIKYIEVKSKTLEEPELIEITGTQWEWARKLYEEGNGDKYNIYVVSNAGNKNAKITSIKNPIKLWKEGKLKAHPVNFEI